MQSLGPTDLVLWRERVVAEGATPQLLDVREPWEVALAPLLIEDCRTLAIPMTQVPDRLGALDPTQPIVCVCHHGSRSAQVVAYLERHGVHSVYNLAGGIDAWSRLVDPRVPRY